MLQGGRLFPPQGIGGNAIGGNAIGRELSGILLGNMLFVLLVGLYVNMVQYYGLSPGGIGLCQKGNS